jgi:hypothetical protein
MRSKIAEVLQENYKKLQRALEREFALDSLSKNQYSYYRQITYKNGFALYGLAEVEIEIVRIVKKTKPCKSIDLQGF